MASDPFGAELVSSSPSLIAESFSTHPVSQTTHASSNRLLNDLEGEVAVDGGELAIPLSWVEWGANSPRRASEGGQQLSNPIRVVHGAVQVDMEGEKEIRTVAGSKQRRRQGRRASCCCWSGGEPKSTGIWEPRLLESSCTPYDW